MAITATAQNLVKRNHQTKPFASRAVVHPISCASARRPSGSAPSSWFCSSCRCRTSHMGANRDRIRAVGSARDGRWPGPDYRPARICTGQHEWHQGSGGRRTFANPAL